MLRTPMDYLEKVKAEVHPLMQKIAHHKLYSTIQSIRTLQIMSQHHVYAVWDFMCLLKALQRSVTCVSIPWFPPIDALGAHLVNEILAEEEGDITSDNRHLCHFDIYLEAMEECKANTQGILAFLAQLKNGKSIDEALEADYVPEPAKHFVKTTFNLIGMKVHEITAGFVFGREDITAKMFYPILTGLGELNKASKFAYYFKRHIELDEGSHAPKAYQLLMNLCDNDEIKWQEAKDAAVIALEARLEFLEGIYQAIVTDSLSKISYQDTNQSTFA